MDKIEITSEEHLRFADELGADVVRALEFALNNVEIDLGEIDDIEQREDGVFLIQRTEDDDLLFNYEEDTLTLYEQEVTHNRFTDEEKEQVAAENINLIHFVLSKLVNPKVEYEELFSVGMTGYAKAIANYDKNHSVKFSTYAVNCIRNEVLYYLRKENKYLMKTTSINKPIGTQKGDSEVSLEEALPDENLGDNHVHKSVVTSEQEALIHNALSFLSDIERTVIIGRYGLFNTEVLTQREISEVEGVNMSQANVSKIQRNALTKLKTILHKDIDYGLFAKDID